VILPRHLTIGGVTLSLLPPASAVQLTASRVTTENVSLAGRLSLALAPNRKERRLRITCPRAEMALPWAEVKPWAELTEGDALPVTENYTNRDELRVWNTLVVSAQLTCVGWNPKRASDMYAYTFELRIPEVA
jgi:hypothetical protein